MTISVDWDVKQQNKETKFRYQTCLGKSQTNTRFNIGYNRTCWHMFNNGSFFLNRIIDIFVAFVYSPLCSIVLMLVLELLDGNIFIVYVSV